MSAEDHSPPSAAPAASPAVSGATEAPPVQAKVIQNGPLQIKGPFQLIDHDGNAYDIAGRRSVLLCRCGGSTTKPFCDGTHSRIGFTAAERAVAQAEKLPDTRPDSDRPPQSDASYPENRSSG